MSGKKQKKGSQTAYGWDEGENVNVRLPNTDSISTKAPARAKKPDRQPK
jgi:hypothetical protein